MKKLIIHGFVVTLFLVILHKLFLLFFTSMNPKIFANIPNPYIFLSVSVLFMFYMIGSAKKTAGIINSVFSSKKWIKRLLMFCHIGAGLLSIAITVCYLILMYIGWKESL